MSTDQQSYVISQFRIKPDNMPTMSSETMTLTNTSIQAFSTALEENAMAIESYQSKFGHLSLVIFEQEYLSTNSNVPFIRFPDPGLSRNDHTRHPCLSQCLIRRSNSSFHRRRNHPHLQLPTTRVHEISDHHRSLTQALSSTLSTTNISMNFDDKYINELK